MRFQLLCSLTVLLASGIIAAAQSPPLPPASTFAPLSRTFTATAYNSEGIESAHSEPLTTTLRFPLTISWDASTSADAAGYRIYMRVLNRTNIYDAGTNTSLTLAPTNQPSPPLNLRLVIPEQSVRLGPPTEPQKFFRTVVQTSTNLAEWQNLKLLQTEIENEGKP